MRKSNFTALLCVLLTTLAIAAPGGHTSPLRLGTATRAGSYYALGLSIQSLAEKSEDLKFEVVETNGSVDNILRLQRGEIDLAIVQNDIAFFAENGLYPFETPVPGLAGIFTFYAEPVFLLTNSPAIRHPSQWANRKINVGPMGSGLMTDARIVLSGAGVAGSAVETHFKPGEVPDLLLNGEIEGAFINDISEPISQALKEGRIFLVPLKEDLIYNITQTYPYFREYRAQFHGISVTTVAVKSILIGKRDLPDSLVYHLTSLLYQNLAALAFPQPGQEEARSSKEVIRSMPLKQWHEGTRDYFTRIGLLKSQAHLTYLWVTTLLLVGFLILIFLLNLIIFSSQKKTLQLFSAHSLALRFIKSVNLNILHHKYVMLLLILLTAYLTDIQIIQYVEHDWAIKHNIISSFDNRSFGRNLLWIFVFGGSGYSDNLFPQSPLGKFLATLIPLFGLGGIFTIVGFITSDHIKRRILEAKGMKTKRIRDHIIVCGWNRNVPFLVKDLLHKNIIHKRKVLILAECAEEMPVEKYQLDPNMVFYLKGTATNREDLQRANLKDADIAIIVADEKSSDPDARNILKILTIEKYSRELEQSGGRTKRGNIYTVAEILDSRNFQIAQDAYLDEMISLGDIQTKIFVQSVLNPGVSKFINEILTHNDYNDIYSIHIAENSKFVNRTFDELLVKLRQYRILLLSISLENRREKSELDEILARHKLTRGVITNPFLPEETAYRTHVGDSLIVLAQYESTIQAAVKEIEKSKDTWNG